MGLLTGALTIGRSALMSYQSALQVIGNNVSNVGSPNYTRQTPLLSPSTGVVTPEGFMPGAGVSLEALKRNVDESLLNRMRASIGDRAQSIAEQETMARIESILQEWTDNDLSSLMQEFFNAFSNLQNQPEEGAARWNVLTSGETLAAEFQRQRGELLLLRDDLNSDLARTAEQANDLASRIADLNVQITALESSGQGGANALRDQRDALLQELSELMDIEVREQVGGGVNVYVGNEPLVQGGLSRGITTSLDLIEGEPQIIVRFADNNGTVDLGSGLMAGIVSSRDELVMGQVAQINSLASAIIREVNKVHASGQGLVGYETVTSSDAVADPDAVLSSAAAGLALTPNNGSFLITTTDQAGTTVTAMVTVDLDGIGTDDTLTTLADKINAAVPGVTAEVTIDNHLRLTADDGSTITFAEDSSNVLAALGINTFFTGVDAQDIAVNSELLANADLLAAATNGQPGDGSNASLLASLGDTDIENLGGLSLMDVYNLIATDVAVKGAAANMSVESSEAITLALAAHRESVSGVNLDEETISLMRLERAFQGAARFTSTVDELMREMLALV